MDRNGLFIVIFLFMIVVDSSHASFSWNFQKLTTAAPNNSSTATQNPPLPSPVSNEKKSNPTPVVVEKPKNTEMKSDPSNVDPKGLNDNNKTSSGNSSTEKQTDEGKSHEVKEKGKDTKHPQPVSSESCMGLASCTDQNKTIIACIIGSKVLTLLVQNEGESALKVNFTTSPTSVSSGLTAFEVPSHQSKKVNVTLSVGKRTKFILNAGNGDCVLHKDAPESERNFLEQFSIYSKQVTPIYGAYFAFLVALVLGGTWACCSFRKRRLENAGIPYQELEMGLPESSAAVNVDTAEGWDEDWDDDWGEDKAVTSPGGLHAGSISANGLTSRKRDGWEADWDD